MIRTAEAQQTGQGPLIWRTVCAENEDTVSTVFTGKGQNYPRHELLGSRVFDCNEADSCWQNSLDIRDVSWLAEHVLLNQILFPAAGYIAMAGESLRQSSNQNLASYAVKDFRITSALLLRLDEKLNLRTRLRPMNVAGDTSQWFEIQISSYDGSHWIEQCVGKVSPRSTTSSNNSSLLRRHDGLQKHVSRTYWYNMLESSGLRYGPAFRGLDDISAAPTEHRAVATISSLNDPTNYIIHPVTIDQFMQIVLVAVCRGQGQSLTELSTVTAIEHLVVFDGGQGTLKIEGKAAKGRSGGVTGDVLVVSEDGHPKLSIKCCEMSPVTSARPTQEDKLLSFVKWDTDATYCNLNQAVASSKSQQDPSMTLDILKLLAHKNPKLRILGIGNGADETTHLILNALKSEFGERLYTTYTYAATDLDAAFRTKAGFKGTRNINVVFFDLEQQLHSHILGAGAYDLRISGTEG